MNSYTDIQDKTTLVFHRGSTTLTGDLIQLKDGDGDSQQTLLEMYAFSNALAQSVKLAMWETSFNNFVEAIENVTEVKIENVFRFTLLLLFNSKV